MTTDTHTIVIGAGVAGLAIARAISLSGRSVMVLEQHGRAGMEVSQHSSEVIHAGLYYPTGSLKARLCRQGNIALHKFAEDNSIAIRRYGKLLVAASEPEIAVLEAIAATAAANGVDDLLPLSRCDVKALEPELDCVRALYSPSTGVIDSQGFIQSLEGHVSAKGGEIFFKAKARAIARRGDGTFFVDVESARSRTQIASKALVIAAGLHAPGLGALLEAKPGYRVPETYFAKGHYFALQGRAPFRHLVYPVPSAGGLGIHLTLDVAGQARFGPDIEWRPSVSYEFEDESGERRAAFECAVRRYWPRLPNGALVPGTTGVRPKLTRAGETAADFAIHGEPMHGIPQLVGLYGIDSPGLTASLAIGQHVAQLLA